MRVVQHGSMYLMRLNCVFSKMSADMSVLDHLKLVLYGILYGNLYPKVKPFIDTKFDEIPQILDTISFHGQSHGH